MQPVGLKARILAVLVGAAAQAAAVPSPAVAQADLAQQQQRIASGVDLPGPVRVVLTRARLRQQEGRHEEAVQLLTRWLAEHPGSDQALLQFTLGAGYDALGQQQQALAAFRAAVQAEPRFGQAWLRLGEAAYGQGRFAEAAEAFDRGGPLTPEAPPEILYYAGVSWLQADRPKQALDRLVRLLESAEPAHPVDWYEALVAAALAAGQGPRAEPCLDSLLAQRPDDSRAWYLAFQLAAGQERHRGAAVYLTITNWLRPLTPQEWRYLGDLYWALEVPLQAARCYQAALAKDQNPTADESARLAGAYIAAHETQQARRILRAALEREATPGLWSLLGDLEAAQADFAAALQAYARSCALDPGFGRGWLMQGYCALELDDRVSARRHLTEALKFEAQATSARALLGQLER